MTERRAYRRRACSPIWLRPILIELQMGSQLCPVATRPETHYHQAEVLLGQVPQARLEITPLAAGRSILEAHQKAV